jgi:hypothetical protein
MTQTRQRRTVVSERSRSAICVSLHIRKEPMKRTILCSTFAVVALATSLVTQSAFAGAQKAVQVAAAEGDACDLEGGMVSGYMVSTGRSGELICVAVPQS